MDLGRLFDRRPPASPEAEMSLLGSMVLDPAVINDVQQVIRDADAFYVEAHRVIFQALVTHYDAHQAGDVTLLLEALKGRDALEPVGGVSYIERLVAAAPAPTNAVHYARVVAEKHRLRRLAEAAGAILYDAFHMGEGENDTLPAVIDRAERLVFEVAEESQVSVAERLSELLHQTMEALDANEGRAITGVATGYLELDEITSGLQPGEMIIVAARPSMGKTALALNLAEQVALGGGPGASPIPSLFFSLEMSRQAVAQRLLCARSGVDSQRLRRNMLKDEDYQRLMATCGELDAAPLFIDDTPGMTVTQLRARARRAFTQHRVGCVFVDYLQLLTAPGAGRESRQVEVSAISRGIKALARELNVPIVCLSQLNRAAEQREGHRPRMSDLRESGSIEQDADVIMLLHREAYYHKRDSAWTRENADRENVAELIIAKQRNGPTGVVELEWDARTTRFHQRQWRPAVKTAPAASAPAPAGAFGSRPRTGPAEDHRDGGGPDEPAWDEDDAPAPF
ncbi:MAG: replicative DNA helicase [Planctomycetota bacterium]|nr:MAG: replicative DNA helicase [Planctomycetota bacterium]